MTYEEVKILLQFSLNIGTRWTQVVSFTPRPPCPQELAPDNHWIGYFWTPEPVLTQWPEGNGTICL
jgi:hypothetical protein